MPILKVYSVSPSTHTHTAALIPHLTILSLLILLPPLGGRVDVDGILMGFSYNQSRAKTDPDFKDYIW